MEAFPLDSKHGNHGEKALKDFAGEVSYDMQGSTINCLPFASNGEARVLESFMPSYGAVPEKSCLGNGKIRASKQKWRPASGGTVSSILGKDYVKYVPVSNGSSMGNKPVKLDSKEFPMPQLWGEESKTNLSNNGHMQKDVKNFLFRMLGEGFQLARDVIHQVLDSCGYDIQESMDRLFDLSTLTLDDASKSACESTDKTVGVPSNCAKPLCQKTISSMCSYACSANGTSRGRLPEKEERNDRQKEVLVSLFNAADRAEGLSRRRAREERRSRALGDLVVEPPRERAIEGKSHSVDLKQDNDNNEEDTYQQLRTAVMEYRATMKEYYKAAVNAFAKEDYDRANKLMEQGHFFHEKARKADEESRQKIFETKNVDRRDELLLDLHDHGAKEAMRLLKCHLSSLSGIASIKYLKVIIESSEEDTSKGARRRWVMKLLDRESIQWREDENAGTILIRLDNINRNGLSFTK